MSEKYRWRGSMRVQIGKTRRRFEPTSGGGRWIDEPDLEREGFPKQQHYDVHMIEPATGKRLLVREPGGWTEGNEFRWTEGNESCPCNRGAWFGYEDVCCTDSGRFLIERVIENGVKVYWGEDWPQAAQEAYARHLKESGDE